MAKFSLKMLFKEVLGIVTFYLLWLLWLKNNNELRLSLVTKSIIRMEYIKLL